MSLPPAIPLVTHGDCPHCGQRLLGLAQAKCGHCGRSLVPQFEALESVGARLREMAPGWTVPALLDWVRPRPAQLAWVHQNQQWPLLAHFVAEGLWGDWQQWEQTRRTRGVSLQVEDVQVATVHLVGLGEWHDWALIRLHGQRPLRMEPPLQSGPGRGHRARTLHGAVAPPAHGGAPSRLGAAVRLLRGRRAVRPGAVRVLRDGGGAFPGALGAHLGPGAA